MTRLISLTIGGLCLYLLIGVSEYSAQSTIEFIIRFTIGIAFVLYGAGGNSLLSKVPLIRFFSTSMKSYILKKPNITGI